MSVMEDMWAKFQDLGRTLTPTRFVRQEPAQPSYDQMLAAQLEGWANQADCTEFFLPWLDKQIDAAAYQVVANIDSHSKQSFWTGRTEQLKDLRKQFHTWSGTSGNAPAKE